MLDELVLYKIGYILLLSLCHSSRVSVPPGTSLHLFLHRAEEDGLSAGP